MIVYSKTYVGDRVDVNVSLNGVALNEWYSFPQNYTELQIEDFIQSDLVAKGYAV